MQLRVARLCLNCEEVHDAQHCPLCASETYAFLKKWVPVDERRARPRWPPKLFKPTKTQTVMFGGGVISLITYWALRTSSRIQEKAVSRAGELR
jgi:hypothetical protein